MVKQQANKEVGFDIFSIGHIRINKELSGHLSFGNFNSIVSAQEVLDFFNAYQGPKDLCEIYRMHDKDRPSDLFRQGLMWITRSKRKNVQVVIQAREQLMQRKGMSWSAASHRRDCERGRR